MYNTAVKYLQDNKHKSTIIVDNKSIINHEYREIELLVKQYPFDRPFARDEYLKMKLSAVGFI